MAPGDVVMLNDPFRGGTHLPDITLVAPVYVSRGRPFSRLRAGSRPQKNANRPDFYVASRAHHADVGGTYAGSMGLCREIYQEGFRIPPVRIMRAGVMDRDVLALLLNNVRTPEEREGDLGAQIAACHTGAARLAEVCARYGIDRAKRAARELLAYSEELMRAFLLRVPPGTYRAEDFLDNDGISDKPVKIAVTVSVGPGKLRRRVHARPIVTVDFSGSDPQVEGQRKCSRGNHLLRLLLCFPMSVGGGCSSNRRPDAAHPGHRSARDDCERAATGGRRRRQRRNFAAHRRRSAARAGTSHSESNSRCGIRHHE